MNPKLLIVDDERGIVDMIQSYFQTQYDILTAYSGQEALKKVACKPDLILLDINMPGMDGLTVCQQIREHIACPILFLTARMESSDKIIGFQAGADDYIVKPFAMEELLARLRIWSRRTVSLEDPGELCFGDLSYRPSVRQLSGPAGKEVLPKRLAQLIELLLRNAEVPITRNVIFNRIWGPDAEVTDAVIDTYIHLTRQRLAHLQSAVKIQNSRGTGYQLSYEREL